MLDSVELFAIVDCANRFCVRYIISLSVKIIFKHRVLYFIFATSRHDSRVAWELLYVPGIWGAAL